VCLSLSLPGYLADLIDDFQLIRSTLPSAIVLESGDARTNRSELIPWARNPARGGVKIKKVAKPVSNAYNALCFAEFR
jgi:hypothetical protein